MNNINKAKLDKRGNWLLTRLIQQIIAVVVVAILCYSGAFYYASKKKEQYYKDLESASTQILNEFIAVVKTSHLTLTYIGKQIEDLPRKDIRSITDLLIEISSISNIPLSYHS